MSMELVQRAQVGNEITRNGNACLANVTVLVYLFRMVNFSDWYKELPPSEREAYARRAETTTRYIETHLIAPESRRKVPRRDLMTRLIAASNGALSFPELAAYFYGQMATAGNEGRHP